MRRSITFLVSGIFCAVLVTSIISVYLLRDVDHDQIDHLNAAFASLCAEGVIFALVVGGATGLLTLLGKKLLGLKEFFHRGQLSFLLGVSVAVLQYPWDLASRKISPRFADLSLSVYMVVAVVLCTVVLLYDNSRRRALEKAGEA
jgi:hypothetical protein